MHISGEVKVSIVLAAVQIGAAAALTYPEHREIAMLILAFSSSAIVGVWINHLYEKNGRFRMLALIGMVLSAFGLIGFATWYFWPSAQIGTIPSNETRGPNDNEWAGFSSTHESAAFSATGKGSKVQVGEYQQIGKSRPIAKATGENSRIEIGRAISTDTASVTLPPPTAEFANLSISELRHGLRTQIIALKSLQTQMDNDKKNFLSMLNNSDEYQKRFAALILPGCRNLVSAAVSRTGELSLPQQNVAAGYEAYSHARSIRIGGQMIQTGVLVGMPTDIINFLEYIYNKIPD